MSEGNSVKLSSEVKIGALISYVLIILNALYGLFVTPYLIGTLGNAEYGVYKTISSFTAALMVLDLGIGSTVMRYVSKYRAGKQDDKIPNFLAMMFIQALVICVLVAISGGLLSLSLDEIYSGTFTAPELKKAKSLYFVLLANVILHIIQNVVNGIIIGSNKLLFGNGIKLARLLARASLIVALVYLFRDSLVIVCIDIALTALFLVIELLYVFLKLKMRVRLTNWEGSLFLESGKYTLLMFLTTIAAQINNNLDNVIIGALSGPELVTIYSVGLLIFSMYEQLSTSISGILLPTVSNILEESNSSEKIKALIIKVGRIQYMLLGAAVVGFACIGKDFLHIWVGDGYDDVYIITLILMIPSLFELCVNTCLAILRAKNMLTFRTMTLFASTLINIAVTIVLVKHWSYIGAAFGTAASFTIGSLIIMNVYYRKKLKLPMLRIYWSIVARTSLCLIISGAVLFAASRFINGGIFAFALNVLIFCAAYAITLFLIALKREEKKKIPVLKKFIH